MANNYIANIKKYKSAAEEEYNPIFNANVAALKNALSQNQLALEQQKVGINSNFDTQVVGQNRQNVSTKNNFSNQVGARGLGRSSVAVTGLAEMDGINNRQVGEINTNRNTSLSQIDALKTQEQNNYNNTYATMSTDKIATINARAAEIGGRQDELDYRDRRDAIADARYNASRNSGGGGGGGYGGGSNGSGGNSSYDNAEIVKSINNAYGVAVNQGNDDSFLEKNAANIKKYLGTKAYNDMVKKSSKINYSQRSANYLYTQQTNAYNEARQKNVILNNRQQQY